MAACGLAFQTLLTPTLLPTTGLPLAPQTVPLPLVLWRQIVSRSETGDLAIIPYYTVLDGTNTGMHIINTTESTQVVKVRLRRGTDSKDALDFQPGYVAPR